MAVQAVDDTAIKDTAGSVLLYGVPIGHSVRVYGTFRLDADLAEFMDEQDAS